MLALLFSFYFLLGFVHVESNANLDNFIMNEAHIAERRVNEDGNAGYAPFYVVCAAWHSGCESVIPILHSDEGYVGFIPSRDLFYVYYGCLLDIGVRKRNVFNSIYINEALFLVKAKAVAVYRGNSCEYYFETYKQRCRTKISPHLWRTSDETLAVRSYSIGFKIIAFGEMVLAEVHFNHAKKIPIRTKHFVYGVSLAVPTKAYNSIDELVYEEDPAVFRVSDLKRSLKSYWEFNEKNGYRRRQMNEYLKSNELDIIPANIQIAMAHLIPEYDIIDASWEKISRFAHTIAPMWEELYSGVWADVEEMIRKVAFMNQRKLTVFSGTHGELIFNASLDNRRILFLDNVGVGVVVPSLIWKLVIDENYRVNEKKAIVIVLKNLPQELANSNTFLEFELPSCQKTCDDFQWNGIDGPNIRCCEIREVEHLIKELPNIVHEENFDMLMSKFTD